MAVVVPADTTPGPTSLNAPTPGPTSRNTTPRPTGNTTTRRVSPEATESFHWGDAGLGAGTTALTLALGAAGAAWLRRRQTATARQVARPSPVARS
jgi:hypothetical protein